MFEFTMGGAWFRWSALDHRSRWFAGTSFMFAALAGLLCGVALTPATRIGWNFSGYELPLALAGISAAAVSSWLWYKFSLRQDEMFNRVQNWALGMAGAWTCGISTAWMILAKVSVVPAVSVLAIAPMFAMASGAFWLYGARKWAL